MPETTENHDLIRTAQEAVDPWCVSKDDGAGIYLVRNEDGGTHPLDLRDKLGLLPDRPPRKTGSLLLTDTPSFVSALAKHALPQTELFANTKAGTIRAVINAHDGTSGDAEADAGYGDHTITLTLPTTQDWKDWTAKDGKLFDQAAFAEWIEDHLPNFVTPTGADMLELAQTFQATTKVDFASSQRIQTGETQLTYVENTTANAGKKGALGIPDTFTLALQPFERGEVYKVTARFRYRIHDGRLSLGYKLSRPDDVLRDAFDKVVAVVEEEAGVTIWHA